MESHFLLAVIVKGDLASGDVFKLNLPQLVIGREPGVDILITSQSVSRRHARLTLQGDGYLVEDLGSRNGTYLNGEPLFRPTRLKHGDQITLGQTITLEFRDVRPVQAGTLLDGIAPVSSQTRADSPAPQYGQTVIGGDLGASKLSTPPRLTVAVAGESVQTYPLAGERISIGRAEDNQIVIGSRLVSRRHAMLERAGAGYQIVVLPEAGNPVLLDGRPLEAPHPLRHGDTLRIGSSDPGLMVSLKYENFAEQAASQVSPIRFGEKELITIGRDPANDVVIASPNVSRFHAQVERIGQRHRLVDLQSANGTFVNNQRVEGDAWLQPNDVVQIGRQRFVMGQEALDQYEEARGLSVDAITLNKWVRKDLNILKNISLAFQPREFIVVVGQSGGGKSTLVDAIAGYRPATHGMVLVNGTNIYRNFEVILNDIGYVPQRDIIHMELTVYQALDYSARLRMPRDTSPEERRQRILEVLDDLDLAERKDIPIHKLSGGQIKRVSIGVELLTKPGLFFLDEPTSGLDPGTETTFMHLMRRLADQGRTIVMVTHATKNVMLADKVVFLARGGYLAWFGPPEEALEYFNKYRSEREQRSKEMDFDQIYTILDDASKGSAQDWAQRYLEDPAYAKYITEPINSVQGLAKAEKSSGATARPKPKRKSRASGLHQFKVLSARNIKILSRDRISLILMLVAPVAIAALDLVLAPLLGRDLFDFNTGSPRNIGTIFFLLVIDSLLVGGFSQMREFIKEADIYKRERLVNLKIFPYVSSKVWVALLLAFYQAAAFTLIRFTSFDIPGGQQVIVLFYITMLLAALAGMMSGLLASALSPTASAAPLIMILLIVPQIVLSGALAPIPGPVSAIASTRWAFQSVLGITGFGSDVVADVCWQLTDEQRDSLTLEAKKEFGCRCMGAAIFIPGSCDFPGVGQYYKPELDQPAPVEPPPLGAKPAEPVIPAAPPPPADQNDQLAMVKYLNSLQDYQNQVKQIQDQFRLQMTDYENQARLYQSQMEEYQKDRLSYEAAVKTAVNSAEATISTYSDTYSWTFVNKDDPAIFRPWLITAWMAQIIIIGTYFVLILVIFARKRV